MENSFSYQPAADRYEQMPYTYCGEVAAGAGGQIAADRKSVV